MRTIFLTILALALFIPMAHGADIEITITIPDAQVSRLEAAVSSIDCNVYDEAGEITDTLNPKLCLKRRMINDLKRFVKLYEERIIKLTAQQAEDSVLQTWSDTYDDLGAN